MDKSERNGREERRSENIVKEDREEEKGNGVIETKGQRKERCTVFRSGEIRCEVCL